MLTMPCVDLWQLGEFKLGLICGPSGAAKSALLEVHFGLPFSSRWADGVVLVDAFASKEQASC